MSHAPGTLAYTRSGSGPTTVLIHGVAGSQMVWDPLVPLLEKARTVVRVDLMGYGSSPRPPGPCTPQNHVTAVRTTLQGAGLDPPYSLVGLSMGSNLALAYGCAWPDEVDTIVGLAFPYFATPDDARTGLKANVWTRLTLAQPRLAAAVVPPIWSILRRSGAMRFHRGIYTPAMAQDAFRVDFGAFESSTALLHADISLRRDAHTHRVDPSAVPARQRRPLGCGGNGGTHTRSVRAHPLHGVGRGTPQHRRDRARQNGGRRVGLPGRPNLTGRRAVVRR